MDAGGRWITLRYPGTCAGCDRALQRGERAWHERADRTVTCAVCRDRAGAPEATRDSGEPGASARREYERRRQAREDRARRRLGVLGVAAARLMGDPQQIDAWRRGASGEAWLGRRLAQLTAERGVVLLHDRRMPSGRGNIDHVAIGPGGVTVIDAKNLTGKVAVEHRGGLLRPRTAHLVVAGRDRANLVEGVERQVDRVRCVLDERGFAALDVRGALCFVNVDGLPLLSSLCVREVAIDGPKAIARKLVCRPGPSSATEVGLIAHALAAAFPAA
jgi:hypothetical protein